MDRYLEPYYCNRDIISQLDLKTNLWSVCNLVRKEKKGKEKKWSLVAMVARCIVGVKF